MPENIHETEKRSKKEAEAAQKAREAELQAKKQAELAAREQVKKEAKAARQSRRPGLFAKRITSLFIDDSGIKLLAMKGKHVIKWAEVKLEPGAVNDGLIADPRAMGAKIKALFSEQGIKDKKVIIGLPGLHCLSKIISLPSLSHSIMSEAVRREAERELPVSLEDLYLSWQVVGGSREESKVFLIVYERNLVDAMVKTLQYAGIKPYIMDLAPLALTRVVNQKSAVILDIRDSELDLIVMMDGVPELIRSLPLPREEPLPEKLPIIGEELERTIRFYDSQESQNSNDGSLPIFVSGALADKPELLQSLQDMLGRVITSPAPPLKYSAELVPGQFMVNIGLILKKMELAEVTGSAKVNINALPEVYRKGLPVGRVLWPLAGAAAVAVIIFAATPVLSQRAQVSSLRNELAVADKGIVLKQTQQKSLNDQVTQLEKKIAESQKNSSMFSAVIKNLDRQRESISEDLPLVTSSLKSGMTFKSIDHNGSTITVSGQAPGQAAILSYAQKLRDSDRFSGVDIDIKIDAQKQDVMDFTIKLGK